MFIMRLIEHRHSWMTPPPHRESMDAYAPDGALTQLSSVFKEVEWAAEQGPHRPPAGGDDGDKLGGKAGGKAGGGCKRHKEDGGGGGGGRGMRAKSEASEWKFDYYLVLCRKVLLQGKAR